MGELDGALYVEFLPGLFRGRHWNPDSVFLHADAFQYVEHVFAKLGPKYNPYGPMIVGKSLWPELLAELDDLARFLGSDPTDELLRRRLESSRHDVERSFLERRSENVTRLRQTIDDLTAWVRATLREHDVISVLGL